MKTNVVYKIFKALSLVAMTLMLANCSKNNKSTPAAAPTAYQMMNGTCYQNVNGQMVPQTNVALCSGTTAGQYIMVNGTCNQVVNGQYVPQANTSLCSTTSGQYTMMNGICYQVVNGQYIPQANTNVCMNSTNTGGYQTMVCNGPHTDGMQWVQCGTQFNCAGYTLYNQYGQIVRCQ